MSEEKADADAGGFKFAVTLLASLGTIAYVLYTYLQNTPVDSQWYLLVCRLIPVALILVGGLLLYILIKGYTLETQASKYLERLASYIYLVIFSISTIFLVLVLNMWLMYILKIENPVIEFLFVIIIPIAVGTVFFLPLFGRGKKKENIPKVILIVEILLVAFMILLAYLLPPVLYSPLQGHVTVDMESIYYKNNAPIPVLIHVTGPNTNLSVFLVKEESNHNLHSIDNITLIPEQKPSHKTVSDKYLFGNTLDYGSYNVFINTTDLSAGYYELVCIRWGYEETYGARAFYLLNNSQQPSIEVVNAS